MRVALIGGTGHIGTWLTPKLVKAGYHVLCLSRSQRKPYVPDTAWEHVENIVCDRIAEEQDGTFGQRLRGMGADVVIDLTCYTMESARHIVEALRSDVEHFLHCGTIWIHGPGREVPTTEENSRAPISDYGRRKLAIEEFLLLEAQSSGFPATVLHPGHLVGPGWTPLNPAGNFNLRTFEDLASERPVILPNLGLETLHHVHADDVAQAFVRAMACRTNSVGECFHVVSPAAVTLRGYAEAVAEWFGRSANLQFMPWDSWRETVSEKDAGVTWDHIARSPNCSIAKATRCLAYEPQYRSLEAVREALMWLAAQGAIAV